jgi:hypothetical protein
MAQISLLGSLHGDSYASSASRTSWCILIEVGGGPCQAAAAAANYVASSHMPTMYLLLLFAPGVIASNGVNGSPRTEAMPQGSGIQVSTESVKQSSGPNSSTLASCR